MVNNVLICTGKLYNIRVKIIVFGKVNISILSTTLTFLVEGNKTSLDTNHQTGTSEAIFSNFGIKLTVSKGH